MQKIKIADKEITLDPYRDPACLVLEIMQAVRGEPSYEVLQEARNGLKGSECYITHSLIGDAIQAIDQEQLLISISRGIESVSENYACHEMELLRGQIERDRDEAIAYMKRQSQLYRMFEDCGSVRGFFKAPVEGVFTSHTISETNIFYSPAGVHAAREKFHQELVENEDETYQLEQIKFCIEYD